jgi:hypothetical protein
MAGLKVAFALAIAGTGLAFFVGLGSRWDKINVEAAPPKAENDTKEKV